MSIFLFAALSIFGSNSIKVKADLPPCGIGAEIHMVNLGAQGKDLRDDLGELRLRPVTTLKIAAADAKCAIQIDGFHWNSGGVKFTGGAYAWFRDRNVPTTIVGSPIFTSGTAEVRPTVSLDTAKKCNNEAVASTTFGPARSCVAVMNAVDGQILQVMSMNDHSHDPVIRLRPGKRYSAISAGDWAHDVGGEIVLIRLAEQGAAMLDVYTLFGK